MFNEKFIGHKLYASFKCWNTFQVYSTHFTIHNSGRLTEQGFIECYVVLGTAERKCNMYTDNFTGIGFIYSRDIYGERLGGRVAERGCWGKLSEDAI